MGSIPRQRGVKRPSLDATKLDAEQARSPNGTAQSHSVGLQVPLDKRDHTIARNVRRVIARGSNRT